MMDDDLLAIRLVLKGDVEAFRSLVERYQKPLFGLIRNLTGADLDREALAQDVFLAVFRNLASFDPRKGTFVTWLFTIARNHCRNAVARRRPATPGNLPEVLDVNGPEQVAQQAELLRRLDAALDALPFEQRVAFVLAEMQGLSYEEVSRVEGVALGTVKSRIGRARDKLRALLGDTVEHH